MIILKSSFPKLFNSRTLFLFPFAIVIPSVAKDKVVMNHVRIHFAQCIEMLVIGFYLWYGIEFLLRYIKWGNFDTAYYAMGFEEEAYTHQQDMDYLKKRKLYSWIKYMRKP